MSGKPAARQNDMTAEGGPIVQGLRGADRRGVLGMSGRNDVRRAGKPAAGAKVLPGETDFTLPGPLPFILTRA
ncbi:type IV secretion protein Rhs [Salmonella enterica]|nr:type IV secretion protein Rhs [Salmonella enterica]HDW3067921.1 type IV secretion protein Rhs [Salmonella enterica subsp. enterica serovar Havana]EGN7985792.1 type IV secretion protein Rhs [Salmonella enterica]EGN8021044.1 type IV secretion protein Rhs [Salmonella enterica]EGO0194167.1 type IV secretion protein Rhs [Salmonella enterica]